MLTNAKRTYVLGTFTGPMQRMRRSVVAVWLCKPIGAIYAPP